MDLVREKPELSLLVVQLHEAGRSWPDVSTVSRMYDSYSDAAAVVHDLEAADLKPDREISLVANEDARGRDTAVEPTRTETKTGTGTGAGVGATVGGVVGILTGLGIMAIPGIGPLVAAGWLATTLAGAGAGAVAGGLVGALTGAGVSRKKPRCMRKACAGAIRSFRFGLMRPIFRA
jgi:hypothetical protein